MATPKRLPSQAESLDQRKFRYSAFEEQLEWEGLQKDNHSAESLQSNHIGVLSTGSPILAALKLSSEKSTISTDSSPIRLIILTSCISLQV